MLELGGPLDTNETSTYNQDGSALGVELTELVASLKNVSTTALDESLVNVTPARLWASTLVNGREPETLTPLVEDAKVATSRNHAVVETNLLDGLGEHGFDLRDTTISVQMLHLTPQELNSHLSLQYRLVCERKCIEMLWMNKCAENTWCVLEIFLCVTDCNVEVLREILRGKEPREPASNYKDLSLLRSHVNLSYNKACDRMKPQKKFRPS
jgi:hypothetical protein